MAAKTKKKAAKTILVYTKRFEVFSRGKRKAGEEFKSDYINVNDPNVIKRWLGKGWVRRVSAKE
ncbi:MAG: hypothetical protein J6N55_06500 [Anaerovibrio sp.]|uniref:hypothetical protein n=1 Tax=Anaerovibrio sp. TaxID=1872532 RepID=UPI001B057498|nr:hypothetical protein [Anaerovibrio sp.]MBO5588533.1 hypothetical protein [Anaerovibrio sp.]MBO6245913.1 hypothetical protein [Anaerovibrio sp.]